MRNLEVCKKCQNYYCHHTAKPGEGRTMIPYEKHYCQIDNDGIEVTSNGFKFKEENFLLEDFLKLDLPKNCSYKLEHLVIKKGDKND